MLEGLLLPIVLALLTGGGISAFFVYKIARRKVPAEIDSLVVQSSETANLSMANSLKIAESQRDDARKEADRLRSEVASKDARITILEKTIVDLYETIDSLRATVDRVSAEVQSLRRGE